jgi:oligopeptide/dipeptide ABC transporter ATP-binding protein
MTQPNPEAVLSVRNLQVHVRTRRGIGHAVDGVSFDLFEGETLGLVGESGCGKSLTSLALVGLLPKPAAWAAGGQILFRGKDLLPLRQEEMRRYRGKHIAMVLQDPLSALNPVFTVQNQLFEPLRLHKKLRGEALRSRAVELLRLMRIPAPEERLRSYPHQFSGGMRQRVVGAIGISGDPEVLIADEPTTALDVTVQAAYLDLLRDIQQRTRLAVLFITHDFGIVGDICHRVAVMYAGRMVETAPVKTVLKRAAHPYTKALLRSVPDLREGSERLVSISGAPPSVYNHPSGCRFHPRCWLYERLGSPERCRVQVPALTTVEGAADQQIACHFPAESLANEVDATTRAPAI